MKIQTLINGMIVGASLALASSASAVTFSFCVYEYNGHLQGYDSEGFVPPEVLQPIVIQGELTDGGGGTAFFTISNNSTPGNSWILDDRPTLTKFGFDDSSSLLSGVSVSSSMGVVNLIEDNGPSDIPGASNIGFESDFKWIAEPPPTTNGVDPGESVTFLLNGDYGAILGAMESGNLRVAIHVQQIGENDQSAAYVICNPGPDDEIPEPSSGVLIFLTSLGYLIRRRR